jgi:hypothetical protein
VAALLTQLEVTQALLARLLYDTDLCLMEGLRLRIEHEDFDR